MIIEYDTRPDITVDAKLRSLIKSIQLALNELDTNAGNTVQVQTADVSALAASVASLSASVSVISSRLSEIETALGTINGQLTSLDERVTALEQQNG